jgi:hypothetical protein
MLDFLVYQPSQSPASTSALPSLAMTSGITVPVTLSAVTAGPSSSLASVCPASDAAALQRARLTVTVLAVVLGLIPLLAAAIATGAFIRRKGWHSTRQQRIRSWFSSEKPPEYNEGSLSSHQISPFADPLGGVATSTVSPTTWRAAK